MPRLVCMLVVGIASALGQEEPKSPPPSPQPESVEAKADAPKPAAEKATLEKPLVFKGGKILTATGSVFDPGTLVVWGGKIVAVGPADETEIPANAQVRDVAGKTLIPGLIDSHSHLGVYSRPGVKANSDGNEATGPVQADVRALDAIYPFDPGIRMANAGGVTVANIMPGSGNAIGGQTLYVKLRGDTVEEMRLVSDEVLGGLKMANGENPKRVYAGKNQAPSTRMKIAALQRSELIKAQAYREKWQQYRKKLATGEEATPPKVDISLEPLVEVLDRKRTVHFHTHRADDIRTTLRLADEFGFDLVVQHGTEGYKIVDELAKRNVPVSMTLLDSPGGKAEVVDFIEEAGAQFAKAGVKVLINTDDPITESRFLLRTAAISVRGGLSEELALKALTLHAAQALHLSDRIGSLEAGKDADFVVLSGPPFSVYTRVLETYIDGHKVFDLSDPKQRLYQTGGFNLDPSQVPEPKPMAQPQPAVEAPQPESQEVPSEQKKESDEVIILAGRVHTVSKGTIEDGFVQIKAGKIAAVGKRGDLQAPPNAKVLTAKVVTPGLIDAYTVVPLAGEYNIPADQDANENSDPNQADVRVLDAFNPHEPLLRFLLEQGVTVVHASPGQANVIAGESGVFRTHGDTADQMQIKFPFAMIVNLGSGVKETYAGRKPSTRMGTASLIRAALVDAADYRRKVKSAKEGEKPDKDLKLEALSRLLDKETAAVFTAQRADDLMTAVRLIDEFKLRGTLAMAADGYLIADHIAKAKLPVIAHPTMQRVGNMDSYNTFLGNAAALADKGIRVAISSAVEGYVPKTRVIRHEAAIGMVYGLGFDRALQTVTLDAARILGIEEQYGSLDPGKVADVVLYDGDPFEHATHVTHVVLGGNVVHDRQERKQISFARRAYFVSPEIPCCLGW